MPLVERREMGCLCTAREEALPAHAFLAYLAPFVVSKKFTTKYAKGREKGVSGNSREEALTAHAFLAYLALFVVSKNCHYEIREKTRKGFFRQCPRRNPADRDSDVAH
jgi:hypothetical protein